MVAGDVDSLDGGQPPCGQTESNNGSCHHFGTQPRHFLGFESVGAQSIAGAGLLTRGWSSPSRAKCGGKRGDHAIRVYLVPMRQWAERMVCTTMVLGGFGMCHLSSGYASSRVP